MLYRVIGHCLVPRSSLPHRAIAFYAHWALGKQLHRDRHEVQSFLYLLLYLAPRTPPLLNTDLVGNQPGRTDYKQCSPASMD